MNKALIAIVLGGACRTAIPPMPSQGGPSWTELTTEHFIVWTDSSPADGRELIRVMEHLRQIVFGVSVFNPTSNAKAFVIAMRDQVELSPYLPKPVLAVAWPPHFPFYEPSITLSTEGIDHDRRVVTHELTHVISYNALPVQPHWFAEGLASYFETVQLDEQDGSFELGAPLDAHLRLLRQPTGLTHVAEMFTCKKLECRDQQFYASAWALFAYLANHRSADLLRYVQRLAELAPSEQATAWSEVFPDLTPAKLDEILANWIRFGELTVHHYKVKLKDWPITQRALSDADVYTARAVLRDQLDPTGPVPAEATAALAIDPTNVVAQMIRMAHEKRFDLDVARSLTAAHPDDWRAWWLQKLAQKAGEGAEAAHAKVCELVAIHPAVLPKGTCPIAK